MHKEFVIQYNASLDSPAPMSPTQVAEQVNLQFAASSAGYQTTHSSSSSSSSLSSGSKNDISQFFESSVKKECTYGHSVAATS